MACRLSGARSCMAELLPTGVRLTDMTPKWGLVTVIGKDGARSFAITAKEAEAALLGVMPPGCTEEEWRNHEVCLRPCNPGQAVINPDGSLMVNYGVTEEAKRVDAKVMQCPPADYERRGDVLHIEALVAAEVDVPFVEVKPETKGR